MRGGYNIAVGRGLGGPNRRGLSQTPRDNIEEACRALEIRPTECVVIKGDDGKPLVRFTDAGDIILGLGAVIAETESSPYPSTAEAIARDGEGSDLLWISSATGNVYLKGDLFENIEEVWSIPEDSVKIRVGDEVMAFVNSYKYFGWYLLRTVPAGSLILDGHAVYLGF